MSVLCVEQNGQRIIEYSLDTHCEDAGAAATANTIAHCAECVDIPLGVTASANSPKFGDEIALPVVDVQIVAILAVSEYPNWPRPRRTFIRQPEFRAAYIIQRPKIVIQQ